LREPAASTIQRMPGSPGLERNFNRNLVGGAADAPALHLKAGARIFKGSEEQVHRIPLFELLRDFLEGTVYDALGRFFLPFFMMTLTRWATAGSCTGCPD